MATITVKNIPDDLYALLKVSAATNRRSINSEVIMQIERGVRGRRIDVDTVLAEARELRKLTERHPISNAEFNKAKRAGRP